LARVHGLHVVWGAEVCRSVPRWVLGARGSHHNAPVRTGYVPCGVSHGVPSGDSGLLQVQGATTARKTRPHGPIGPCAWSTCRVGCRVGSVCCRRSWVPEGAPTAHKTRPHEPIGPCGRSTCRVGCCVGSMRCRGSWVPEGAPTTRKTPPHGPIGPCGRSTCHVECCMGCQVERVGSCRSRVPPQHIKRVRMGQLARAHGLRAMWGVVWGACAAVGPGCQREPPRRVKHLRTGQLAHADGLRAMWSVVWGAEWREWAPAGPGCHHST